jgi:hypothetical protein
MGVRIWDRLLDREVRLPSGRQQFGRFIMLGGDRGLSVGGWQLSRGDYLAAVGAWTLWDEVDNRGSSGRFERRALPDEITTQCLLAVGIRLDRLHADAASPRRWLEESPLMERRELESQIKRRMLDDQVDKHLDVLRDVCYRPADRLRVVNRLVPVGAARKITPATIRRLAAHSEDWNRILPDGIEPNAVLTPVRVENFDFYENRVAARLVEHLWQDTSRRLGEVEKIDTMVDDIKRYTEQAGERPWRLHNKLFDLIKGVTQNQPWLDLIARRRDELRACRDALFALRGAGVLPGVDRHAEIGTVLRATNLFVNEHRYRRVRSLWQAWIEDRTGIGGADETARVQDLCRAFAAYSALLVLHALDHLGHLDSDREPPFTRGAAPLDLRGTSATLAWLDTDILELAAGGEPILRIIPLPHAVTRVGQEAAVQDEITQLTTAESTVPTLLMYPGSQEERTQLPTRLRLSAFSGCETRPPGTRGWALLPVSPLELDSVTRLARSLRSTLERHRHRGYPVTLTCQPGHARTVANEADWLSARPEGLVLTKPPTPTELATAIARLAALRKRAASRVDLRGDVEQLDRLVAELPTAAERISGFATCPVCLHHRSDPWRVLRPRQPDTYAGDCDRSRGGQCGTHWDLRVCATGLHSYPVLRPESLPEPTDFDGDELDRLFGSELVAAPCWLRPSVFICPLCGVCGEASGDRAAGCRRCSPSTGKANDTGQS